MQPEVSPSRVPPTQQAPDFPSWQLNGCLELTGGASSGFGWAAGFKTGSPGWGMFWGAWAGASCGDVSDDARWKVKEVSGALIPESEKSGKAISNESTGPTWDIGLGTALDMMTVRSKRSFCIVKMVSDAMLATGKIF